VTAPLSPELTFVATISAYVVACLAAQAPAVTLNGDNAQINYGLDYLAEADVFPRIVMTPSVQPDRYVPGGNIALYQDMTDTSQTVWQPAWFGREARFDFHVWGQTEGHCTMMVAMIIEAIQVSYSGVAWPESGFWPQARGKQTLTATDGREYVLTVVANMPVTYATYPTVSGVAPGITTEMDFADGTSQQDPEG
jgi:hypothetical protein